MVKLIVTDVDGTLVPDGGDSSHLNKKYYEIIKRLNALGVTFAVASGRQYSSVKRLFAPISESIYCISEGGGLVFKDGEMLYSQTMKKKIVENIITDIKKLPLCDAMISGIKKVYVENENSKLYRWMKDCYKYDIEAVGDLTAPIDDEIVKVSLFHPENQAEEVAKGWFTDKWSQYVQVSVAGIQWVDLVEKSTNKGTAVQFLQQRFGIHPEETVVFGDNMNDVPMFGKAGVSFAVKNAREEVRKKAAFVCDSYRKDGVYEQLEQIEASIRKKMNIGRR